jgi:DegV family protein with EDD domain
MFWEEHPKEEQAMTKHVAVLTDSTASLPEDMLHDLDIHTVAYYIHRGQEVLRDLVTIQRDEFIAWLLTARFLPTTASPGPGDYYEAYESLANAGHDEIVSIHMTADGSGAYQAATLAQSLLQETNPDVHVEVIDTRNASLCQGWMAVEAARAALAGLRLNEVVHRVRGMIPITHMLQTADTLKYLYMGGRIGKAKQLAGSLLNIKPIIGMEDGVIVARGTARSFTRACARIVEMMADFGAATHPIKVAVTHAAAPERAEALRRAVAAAYDCRELLVSELSPVLGVHTGPGCVGVNFFPVRE